MDKKRRFIYLTSKIYFSKVKQEQNAPTCSVYYALQTRPQKYTLSRTVPLLWHHLTSILKSTNYKLVIKGLKLLGLVDPCKNKGQEK